MNNHSVGSTCQLPFAALGLSHSLSFKFSATALCGLECCASACFWVFLIWSSGDPCCCCQETFWKPGTLLRNFFENSLSHHLTQCFVLTTRLSCESCNSTMSKLMPTMLRGFRSFPDELSFVCQILPNTIPSGASFKTGAMAMTKEIQCLHEATGHH